MVRKISNEKVKRIVDRTENLTGMFRKKCQNILSYCRFFEKSYQIIEKIMVSKQNSNKNSKSYCKK